MSEQDNKRRSRYAKDPEKCKEYHRKWREKNRARIAEYRAEERKLKAAAYLLREARNRAKKQNVPFNLTETALQEMLAPMRCSATGLKLCWDWSGSSRSNPWAPSLDRIEGSRGYVDGNVRIVCWIYNSAKSDWPADLILSMAEALVEITNARK